MKIKYKLTFLERREKKKVEYRTKGDSTTTEACRKGKNGTHKGLGHRHPRVKQ